MKFSLRHALTLMILSGIPSAVTGATGGEPTPLELVRATIAAFGGGILSLWVYYGLKPKAGLAPAWTPLPGALVLMAMSATCGYLLEGTTSNLCQHCGAKRTTYHLWICQVCFTGPSHIEEQFHYHCGRHSFTRLSQNTPLFSNDGGDDTPIVFTLNEQLLSKLALLRPIEKCHVLFEQTNPLDQSLKDVREIAFNQLAVDLFLPETRHLTEAEAVEAWWTHFGPLMQPAKTAADVDRMRVACAGEPWLVRLLPKVAR